MARTSNDLTPPADGQEIAWHADGAPLEVPDRPIIPFIEGDGTGPDIWRATRRVLDGAVEKIYGGSRSIAWFEVLAGEKAYNQKGEWLPQDTLDAIQHYRVAIKGPLTTPVGGGIRSLNVTLRQILDLYACVRPVRYFPGVPSPVKEPEKVDMVIFRENTEDVYAGIEWRAGSEEAKKVIEFLAGDWASRSAPTAASASSRSRRSAASGWSARPSSTPSPHSRKSVTLVHKGNIMKFTEGAFKDWGYEVARDEFGDRTVTEQEVWDQHGGKAPGGQGRGQGPHRRLDVPAGAPASRGVRRPRHHQPQRRLSLRRPGGPGGRARHGPRQQRGGRLRRLRGDARHGAQVRRPGQGQPGLADPLRRDDAALAGLARGRRRHRERRSPAPSSRSG